MSPLAEEGPSSLLLARQSGTPLHWQLVRGLKAAQLGSERGDLCRLRRGEAREALDKAHDLLRVAERTLQRGEEERKPPSRRRLQQLETSLAKAGELSFRLDHALEVLEANSRAAGEGPEAMEEYSILFAEAEEAGERTERLRQRLACAWEDAGELSALLRQVGWPCFCSRDSKAPVVPAPACDEADRPSVSHRMVAFEDAAESSVALSQPSAGEDDVHKLDLEPEEPDGPQSAVDEDGRSSADEGSGYPNPPPPTDDEGLLPAQEEEEDLPAAKPSQGDPNTLYASLLWLLG